MLDFRVGPSRAKGQETKIGVDSAVLYPLFVDVFGKRCVIVGGGKVAARKAEGLLESGASVVVVSPKVVPGMDLLDVQLHRRPYSPGDLSGAFLAFAATDVREVNAAVVAEARAGGVPVNVADRPDEGDFALPSVLRRGGLQVAVSTGGASPTLARRVREGLEGRFAPGWAGIVEQFGAARRRGEKIDADTEREVVRCLSQLRG